MGNTKEIAGKFKVDDSQDFSLCDKVFVKLW